MFHASGYAQYHVREANGKIKGILTKAETMKQLVKKRVTMSDPVSKLVNRELRNVSLGTTLSELGRVLARNKFALVNKTKFVTTSDLLRKVAPVAAAGGCCAQETCCDEPSSKPASAEIGAAKMLASAVVGMSMAALGTFLLMK